MNQRIWSISIILFLSSAIWSQQRGADMLRNADRYLQNPLPQQWGTNDSVFVQVLPVDDQWWKTFRDPVLDSLIIAAVRQNYSVLTALNRIEAARANLNISRGNYYPTLGLDGGWTKQQTSGNIGAMPQSRQHYFSAAATMSWEADVFGSIRNRVKAQKELFAASRDDYNATMVSLCSEVATAYINLRGLQQELGVVSKNNESQFSVVRITEVRYNTGLVSKLDVAQAKSVYFSTKASIPQLESAIMQQMNALSVLLGVYPHELRAALETDGVLPDYMELVGVGVPANLLLRRPDVRSAERQISAQAAMVGASRADWFPKFFLKGSVGYASEKMKNFIGKKSLTYEFSPTVSINLFEGTKLINATRLAKTELVEAVNNFNQTVLTAVQETDDAMSQYRSSIKQIVALREVINQGQETLTLSLDLYKQGLSPFQNVLDAQRSLLSYENSLVQAQANSLVCLINMYKALGGGWQAGESGL